MLLAGSWIKNMPYEIQMPPSILIVKLSAIGDVVHTLPLLEVLRKNFPEARIDWLVEKGASGIIDGHKGIDQVIVSHRKSWQRDLFKVRKSGALIREISRFIKEVRHREYDLVIDLQGLFKSGILTFLSIGKRKIGFIGGREGAQLFLTERPFPVDYNQHAIERYLKIADYLRCDRVLWRGDIPISQSDRDYIDKFIKDNDIQIHRMIAMNPMAKWKTKLWEPEKFTILADRIRNELAYEIIFTGSKQDRAIIDKITDQMKGEAINLAGRTSLKELAYLYSKCQYVISTDTGPMHLAAAMSCPVIAIFGPTAPWRTGPYGKGHKVIRDNIECSPCFKKRCTHVTCMKNITVDRVFNRLKECSLRDTL